MQAAIDRHVRSRAGNRCEYCQLPQSASPLALPIDHIVARQHGGTDADGNLALACAHCNGKKGPNITGIDPVTRRITRLFNPRRDNWAEHFEWAAARLIGLTAIGRTTVYVLDINHPDQIELRESLADEDRA